MTQVEIKALASEIIGDGQLPNKFFVTEGPYVMVRVDEYESDFAKIEGFEDTQSTTYGPFDSYEDALEQYNECELDEGCGIGQVFIEDRLSGQMREKYLEKEEKVITRYTRNEYSM
jgi:hypothetical protein